MRAGTLGPLLRASTRQCARACTSPGVYRPPNALELGGKAASSAEAFALSSSTSAAEKGQLVVYSVPPESHSECRFCTPQQTPLR